MKRINTTLLYTGYTGMKGYLYTEVFFMASVLHFLKRNEENILFLKFIK